MDEYEKTVIRAILTHDDELWSQAHALSCIHNLTNETLTQCHLNIERWLRLHGVSKMFPHEEKALILIQSTIRRWIVLKSVQQQLDLYSRLASIDSPDHCTRALKLQKTLAYAWEHIQSC